MKKSIILLFLIGMLPKEALAQLQKGDICMQGGLGIASIPSRHYGRGINLHYLAEYCFNPYLSAGIQTDLIIKTVYLIPYNIGPAVSFRTSLHYGKWLLRSTQTDLYLGASAGYHFSLTETPFEKNSDTWNYPIWGGYLGVKHYFKPRVGVFAEVGHQITYGKMGIAFKF